MRFDRALALMRAQLPARLDDVARVPVLMYHSVSLDDERGVGPYYRLTISPRRFREQMRWLADNGYSAVSLEDIATRAVDVPQGRRCVITFDDGYADFMDGAWPALDEAGFRASIFVPTAYISTQRKHFKGRECLTETEVVDLYRRGISFGSHTVNHPVLNGMDWNDIAQELQMSRRALEELLACPVVTFAYPFAFPQHDRAFVRRFCSVLADTGYLANVTTIVGRHFQHDDPLQIKRVPVNEGDDLPFFAAKLRGAYDWVGTVQAAAKMWRSGLVAAHGGQYTREGRASL